MKDLLDSLYTKINTLATASVKFQTAPNSTAFPYMTYNLVFPDVDYETEVGELEVNVWSNSSEEVFTEADKIWTGLDKYSVGNGTIAYSVRKMLYSVVPDEDEEVYRVQMTFQVLYQKEQNL